MISYIFSKRQLSQTSYLYTSVWLIWASKYHYLHTNARGRGGGEEEKEEEKECRS